MVVSPAAVNNFLDRPLRSFAWIKDYDDVDLDAEIEKLLPQPHFHTKPWRQQKACFLLGINRPHFIFYLDLGLGKSALMLNIIHYRKFGDNIGKTLWLTPNLVNITSIGDQCALHQPTLRAVLLKGGSEIRWQQLEQVDGDIYVINYQGLTAMLCREIPKGERVGQGRGRRKKEDGWMIDQEALDRFLKLGFDCIVMDEIQAVKNPASLYHRLCLVIGEHCRFRYGLSGTPMNVNPQDFWGEFYCIDHGDTLGRTLTVFRQAYFKHKVNYFGAHEHTFIKKLDKDLKSRLQNRSIRYEQHECGKLPDKISTILRYDVPATTMRYYRNLKEEFDQARKSGNRRLLESSFTRLRQLSSGFVTVNGDNGKVAVEFAENPKLDGLAELIRELPAGRKMVIFTDFVWSTERVARMLQTMKIEHAVLYGKTADHEGELRKFERKADCTIMVANAQSGAVGLNWQFANYVAFFECPVAPITRTQAEGRVHRSGQTLTCFQYDLVMRETEDEAILENIREGRNLQSRLLDDRGQRDLFRR